MGFGIYYPTASSPYWQYYYFGKNLQGDVIALYRSDYNSTSKTYTPTLVATYTYDPWGAPTGIYDANGSTISQTAYHVAAYNPFRYRGYRYDGDTRLYYLQSRYYDPAIGRFINADGYASTGQGFIACNMFCYCGNNPVMGIDSTGKSFWFGAFLMGPNTWEFLMKLEKIYEWVNGTLHPEYSIDYRPQSIDDYRTADGTYAAYDNHNFNPESVFHEQILAVDIDGFGFDDDGKPTYASAGVTCITGGWETDNFDLSLFDFGRAEVSAGFGETGVAFFAMATVYQPSASYDFGLFSVTIGADIGSIGGGFDLRKGKLDMGGALGLGAHIAIEW